MEVQERSSREIRYRAIYRCRKEIRLREQRLEIRG
jgi:hypothetical protein